MNTPIIEARNITYHYPNQKALDNVSFTIKEGSITALAGPNGAGKSTLMRCLAGLEKPFSGKVFINGINADTDPRDIHRVTGYLSDFFGLYDNLSVRQCLTYFAWSRLIPNEFMQSQIDWLITLLGLEDVIDKKAGDLSRGWRQRVGIAQSIIHNPKLLILDEPASGLDPESRQKLSGILRTLRDEYGISILVSSHILAELEDYCDSMLILRDGRLIDHIEAGTTSNDTLYPLFIDYESAGDVTKLQEFLSKKGAMNITVAKDLNDYLKSKSGIKTLHFELPLSGFQTESKNSNSFMTSIMKDAQKLFPNLAQKKSEPEINLEDIPLSTLISLWLKEAQKRTPVPICGIGLRSARLQDLYMQHGIDTAPIAANTTDKKEG